MAEIVGAVASGAGLFSLALQLADCAVKLKSFCEEVKKAPKSLQSTIVDLETLSLLLRQLDGLRLEYGSDDAGALERCINVCRGTAEKIVNATKELEEILARFRLFGRVYSAIKLRDIVKQCDSLERSKQSLALAFQLFDSRTQIDMMQARDDLLTQQSLLLWRREIVAQIRLENEAMIDRMSISNLLGSPQHEPSKRTHSLSDSERQALKRRPSRTTSRDPKLSWRSSTTWQLQIPSWFSNRIWLISVSHSKGDWHTRLQTFYIRPFMCEARRQIFNGNVEVVRKMFAEGTASPADVYQDGMYGGESALTVCAV